MKHKYCHRETKNGEWGKTPLVVEGLGWPTQLPSGPRTRALSQSTTTSTPCMNCWSAWWNQSCRTRASGSPCLTLRNSKMSEESLSSGPVSIVWQKPEVLNQASRCKEHLHVKLSHTHTHTLVYFFNFALTVDFTPCIPIPLIFLWLYIQPLSFQYLPKLKINK